MEKKETDKIMAFDSLFTTNQIQMLKVLLSYMEPSARKTLAIYIKLMELQYTISFFHLHPHAELTIFPSTDKKNTVRLYDEIIPFCDISQREKILQMKNMMQNLENMQEMFATLEMMKELFPEGMGNMEMGNDFSQIFNMFGGGFPLGASDAES